MTPDDHKDNSICNSFIKDDVAYMSNAVLEQFINDLLYERESRKSQEKCKGEIALDDFMKQAREIDRGMKELMNKEGPF